MRATSAWTGEGSPRSGARGLPVNSLESENLLDGGRYAAASSNGGRRSCQAVRLW